MANEIVNPGLRAHRKSCTHAVVVKYLGAWSVVTWCKSHSEAKDWLWWWRQRSDMKHKIIKIKEKS